MVYQKGVSQEPGDPNKTRDINILEQDPPQKRAIVMLWDPIQRRWEAGYDMSLSSLGRPKSYETSVAVAGTPNYHEVETDLGRKAHDGYVINDDAANDLYIYISNDGTNYNGGRAKGSTDKITIKAGEGFFNHASRLCLNVFS